MFERLRRWLVVGVNTAQFRMECNHCGAAECIDARELTVQVTDQGRSFLACACEHCRRPMATQVNLMACDLALQGGARMVHLVEAPAIREKDIRRFVRTMDDELAEFLS